MAPAIDSVPLATAGSRSARTVPTRSSTSSSARTGSSASSKARSKSPAAGSSSSGSTTSTARRTICERVSGAGFGRHKANYGCFVAGPELSPPGEARLRWVGFIHGDMGRRPPYRARPAPREEKPSKRGAARSGWCEGKSFAWERPLRGTELRRSARPRPRARSSARASSTWAPRTRCSVTSLRCSSRHPISMVMPSVLIRLGKIDPEELREVLIEAWIARAPQRLAQRVHRNDAQAPGNQVE